MNQVHQNTLKGEYKFSGKGLHTGKFANITLKPAPVDTGIVFHRTDIGEDAFVQARADKVSSTARSTTITAEEASVMTIEHLLSAMTGMGIDNVIVEVDNVEIPILDGSAKPYIDAIWSDGIQEQDAPRKYVELTEPVEISNPETGAYVKIEPADETTYDLTVDFNSKVLGVQTAHWDSSVVYAEEIGVCRTFVFFHELEFLFNNNLIKGGDADNAIVIVEHPVTKEQLERMTKLFDVPMLDVSAGGYLNNLELRFPNECSRHKLLDLMGDLRLCGGFLKAKVTGYKAGHSINTKAAAAIVGQSNN